MGIRDNIIECIRFRLEECFRSSNVVHINTYRCGGGREAYVFRIWNDMVTISVPFDTILMKSMSWGYGGKIDLDVDSVFDEIETRLLDRKTNNKKMIMSHILGIGKMVEPSNDI